MYSLFNHQSICSISPFVSTFLMKLKLNITKINLGNLSCWLKASAIPFHILAKENHWGSYSPQCLICVWKYVELHSTLSENGSRRYLHWMGDTCLQNRIFYQWKDSPPSWSTIFYPVVSQANSWMLTSCQTAAQHALPTCKHNLIALSISLYFTEYLLCGVFELTELPLG